MQSNNKSFFNVVGIASSAGGFKPMIEVISGLPPDFPASVLVVQHTSPDNISALPEILSGHTSLKVKEAEEGDRLANAPYIQPGPIDTWK